MSQWHVVVVEPDLALARAHVKALAAQSSFRVVGVAMEAEQAAKMIANLRPHLVLIELDVEGGRGLELLRRLRMAGNPVEAIVVTSRTDSATVRAAMQVGVVDYVLKPFRPERLRQALGLFLRRSATVTPGTRLEQSEIDQLTSVAPSQRRWLPRELQPERLEQIRAALLGGSFTAEQVGRRTGVARTTARRYLEYLVTVGEATCEQEPSGPGRPTKTYCAQPLVGAALAG